MIELRHLRYFRAVAEEQNFHRAAERIPVDLSALSRAVRELEDYVGVELLVRSPAGTRITPIGWPVQINTPSFTDHVAGEVFTSTQPARSLPLNKSTQRGADGSAGTCVGIKTRAAMINESVRLFMVQVGRIAGPSL